MHYQKIIDISLPIYEGMPIYPNNPGFSTKPVPTPHSYLSEVTMGTHTGTHIDAPRHVFKDGKGVDEVSLERLIGPCRVLDMTHKDIEISEDDLIKEGMKKGERIFVKTKNSLRGFETGYDDYVYITSGAAELLGECGVALFGIDALSIKKRGSSDNRPHTELLRRDIVIFEGLDLSRVKAGEYFFIGLPLKLVGLDGAPARALLLCK